MSAGFTQGALRLAGLVPRWLGWRPDDFWNATPAELAAIACGDEAIPGEPLSRGELERLLRDHGDG